MSGVRCSADFSAVSLVRPGPRATAFEPLEFFCCGCPLDLGVQIILGVHSLASLFYVFTSFSNLVLDVRTPGYFVSPPTQIFNCGFALASVPFIISGYSGMLYHIETHLQIYMIWLAFTFAFDLACVAIVIAKSDCASLPKSILQYGSSFACGASRLTSIGVLLMFIGTMAYALFTVWSRCQQLKAGGSEVCFDELVGAAQARDKAARDRPPRGLFGTGPTPPSVVSIAYGSVDTPPVGGSVPIFGGRTHDSNYPPAP